MGTGVYLRFQLDAALFAFPLDDVQEILPLPRLAKPPQLPPAIEGLLDLSGETLAVLRLGLLLGLETSTLGLYAHLLRMRNCEPGLALLVDRATGVAPAAASKWRNAPSEESFRGCVVGQLVDGDETAHVLSFEHLLSEHERRKIEAFLAAERQRRLAFEEPP